MIAQKEAAEAALVITNEARIIAKALKGLAMVTEGENKTIEGWLLYGAALNEGRAEYPSDEKFGQWVKGNLPETEQKEREASMWAAGNPEQFRATRKAHPNVRTVRGLHAKFKAPAPMQPEAPTAPEMSMLRKLKALADHPETDPGTKANAKRKLDGYLKTFGIDPEDLKEPENPVGMTRRDMMNEIIKIVLKHPDSPRSADLIRMALNAAFDDDELRYNLNLVREIFQ